MNAWAVYHSHEEQTTAYALTDDVPEEVKQARAAEIMEIQRGISWEINQEKIGQCFRCMIDRIEGGYFVGRTEMDSPDVDNEVFVPTKDHYLKVGDFTTLEITAAEDFDLYAVPVV